MHKTTPDIASVMAGQNNAILQAMVNPQKCRQYGYFEDPHGQTIYVDGYGNTHRLHDETELNGWTV